MQKSLPMTVVHVEWVGPYSLAQLDALRGKVSGEQEPKFGVYQIYGQHRLYGPNSLLYIGKAVQQNCETRVLQEGWSASWDPAQVQVYIGRLGMPRSQMPKTTQAFTDLVDDVESLLIYAHGPACNSAKLQSLSIKGKGELRVMNWGAARDLMPEVSTTRWDRTHWQHPDYDWLEPHSVASETA